MKRKNPLLLPINLLISAAIGIVPLSAAIAIPESEIGPTEWVASSRAEPPTLLDVLQDLLEGSLPIDPGQIFQVINALNSLLINQEIAVDAVQQQAEEEEASELTSDFSNLPDLRMPGQYSVEKRSLRYTIAADRLTSTGSASSYEMPVNLYLPQDLDQPAPLIVISHGLGGSPSSYDYLAQHLASYGFAVAAPEHIGSSATYRQIFLEGDLENIVEPTEFINRSLDITNLLDSLEQQSQQDDELRRINLRQVGIVGHSLGATTALSVAGAEFNPDRLQEICSQEQPEIAAISISTMVQCIAQDAPFADYSLRDRRVRAVFAIHPLSNALFGAEGMAQIDVPTFILGSSEDFLAPVVQDQLQPFTWLETPEKYLALMVPGTHFSTSNDPYIEELPRSLIGPDPAIGREYLQTLSVAFFSTTIGEKPFREQYSLYLSAAYMQNLSQEPLQIYLVRTLRPEAVQ